MKSKDHQQSNHCHTEFRMGVASLFRASDPAVCAPPMAQKALIIKSDFPPIPFVLGPGSRRGGGGGGPRHCPFGSTAPASIEVGWWGAGGRCP